MKKCKKCKSDFIIDVTRLNYHSIALYEVRRLNNSKSLRVLSIKEISFLAIFASYLDNDLSEDELFESVRVYYEK